MTEIVAPPSSPTSRRPLALPALADVPLERLAIPVLALLAGLLSIVNLTVSGYANTYYAIAAQAGSQSWSALFFGALDAQGFITIDKPPLATWLMSLSVRAFGLSSSSILLPQALLGVASVVVLYLAVRRSFGAPAAFIAGVVMAITPVSVLIFRYDNPDALLTFLLVTAAWALGRAIEAGRLRWVILAASLVGAGFLTKYLQAYLVLPAFILVWLVAAPVSLQRRIGGLLAAGLAVVISSGWWVAIVELLPASARPYIGGSTTNSVLELVLGYDGLGRIFGNRPAGSGLGSGLDGLVGNAGAGLGGGGGASFGGEPGLLRLFNPQFAGEIAWLLPAALIALASAVVIHRRARRTAAPVAGYVLWGCWLLVHLAVFSFMSGIIHPYYTVIIAPAIAALTGAGVVELWRRRDAGLLPRLTLAAGIAVSGAVAWLILARTPAFAPGLGIGIAAIATAAALVLLIPGGLLDRRIGRLAAALALAAVLAGPLSYAAATMASAHGGGDPAAGPATAGEFSVGPGGIDTTADAGLVAYLTEHQGSARWIVAVSGSQSAASIQLTAGQPVMSMGGFTGSDPTPTLAQLKAYIASGELRFVIVGGGGPNGAGAGPGGFGGPGGGLGGSTDAAARTAWITATCTVVASDGGALNNLYDCAGTVAP